MLKNKLLLIGIVPALLTLHACSGCNCSREMDAVQVSGQSLALTTKQQAETQQAPAQATGPRIIEIKAKPYVGPAPTKDGTSPATEAPVIAATPPKGLQVPPGAAIEEGLTKRLTDKLKEANIPFNEKNPPKIYTSNQNINEFSNYYESKGQKVSRMAIPASVLIRPLLQDHPELASKIDANALDKVTINQVVVEGSGISAADKYIDPDTLQVVDKLFVTDMPSDMGKKE